MGDPEENPFLSPAGREEGHGDKRGHDKTASATKRSIAINCWATGTGEAAIRLTFREMRSAAK